MKTKLIILNVMLLSSITSCQEYDFGFTEQDVKLSEYNRKFEQTFGVPQENHNWGFYEQPILEYPTSTRAGEGTAGIDPNSNEWESKYLLEVPKEITEAERKYVTEWFATHKLSSGETVHWSNFFMQYVDCKENQMNELQVLTIDGVKMHIYNYNNSTKATQYVYSAGTEEWSYASTQSTGKYYRAWDLYNIQHLVFTGEDGVEYDGWYVGFDYETAKELSENRYCDLCGSNKDFTIRKNTENNFEFACSSCGYVNQKLNQDKKGELSQFKAADGYFNDWIIKVTPGTHNDDYPATTRVMCEDLGRVFDWDYNDVVFDATFTNQFVTIVLRAVGGTMPIYVGKADENYECHKLLGDGPMTPIIHPETVVIYTLDYGDIIKNTGTSIPIYVKDFYTEAIYPIVKINDIGKDTSKDKNPFKFGCPSSVDWTEECQNISSKYSKFEEWVNDDTKYFWE